MNHYIKDQDDKINILNRCFFDAEHGRLTLSLRRISDLSKEFPDDSEIEYVEALIRKDFLGQGLLAEELFIKAQTHSKQKNKSNENYLFSTSNAVKYARNVDEFHKQFQILFSLNPEYKDISLLKEISFDLNNGVPYTDILIGAVAQFQKYSKHGDCASFAELALYSGNLSLDNELELRKARMMSLRELDKAAEASRSLRGEGFPPTERIVLKDALTEIEQVLILDPLDHVLWNFKSAWLYIMDECDDSIIAADKSLELCSRGYLKPRINKALCLQKKNNKPEALREIEKILEEAKKLGDEMNVDKELALKIQHDLTSEVIGDNELLSNISRRITSSFQLTSKKELNQWVWETEGNDLLKGLKNRVLIVGKAWNNLYIKIMEEMLVYFSPESALVGVLKLSDSNQTEYEHCVNAILYLAANSENVLQRDACQFLIYVIVGGLDPEKIKKVYREAILGPTAVGPDKFSKLEQKMREEIGRFNPVLLKLLIDQPPLSQQELYYARNITMARFIDGISRDPVLKKESTLSKFFNKLFGKE
jgi:tetratricopeptide (TPR) repeat protein